MYEIYLYIITIHEILDVYICMKYTYISLRTENPDNMLAINIIACITRELLFINPFCYLLIPSVIY